jgi:hypothetical protein
LPLQGPCLSTLLSERIGDVKKSFATACKRAGISDFRMHDMRHTCAAWLVNSSAAIVVQTQDQRCVPYHLARLKDGVGVMEVTGVSKRGALCTVWLEVDVVSYVRATHKDSPP